MTKKYEFRLDKYYGEIRLTDYKDEDSTFKCTFPTSKEDKIVVENFKGLLKKLNLNELKIKMEIK